ncbi:MAG: hypothetical protein IKE01_04490 [Clostridia bacterium]|nr:hypothetical protein [Clostridia bacterium]
MASSLDEYINDESGLGLNAIMAKHKRDFYFVLFDESIDNDTKMDRIKILMKPFREALKEYNLKSAPEFVDRNIGIIESNVNEITRVINEWNRLRQGKIGMEPDAFFIQHCKENNDNVIEQLSSAQLGSAELTEIFKLVEKQRKSIIEEQQKQDISKVQKNVSENLEQGSEASDIEPATVEREPEQEDIGMSGEQGAKLVALVKELMTIKREKRKAEIAALVTRCKELKEDIEESMENSSEEYLRTKKGMQKINADMRSDLESALGAYEDLDQELANEESQHYLNLDDARAKLGARKLEVQLYKKEPDVQLYIGTNKMIENLEYQLTIETDELKRADIQEKIEQKKAEIAVLETRENVSIYKKAKESIDPLKQTIKEEKQAMKVSKDKRKNAKMRFGELKREIKAVFKGEKQNLPVKQNRFMRAIGAIRAKLGIGKHKDEKNLADAMTRASEMLTTFAERTGENIKEGVENAKSFTEKAIQDAQQAAISGLETALTKLIEAEKGHTMDTQTRRAPTQGDLEPSI